MSSVARVIEVSAMSETSFEDAIQVGIQRASQTLRGLTSAWVKDMNIELEPSNGSVKAYKVNLAVTFMLDDSASLG